MIAVNEGVLLAGRFYARILVCMIEFYRLLFNANKPSFNLKSAAFCVINKQKTALVECFFKASEESWL